MSIEAIRTWAERRTFHYDGSIATGTIITYGQARIARISSEQYKALRAHFINRVIPVGTSRTKPPAGSLGSWLQKNVTRTAIASYVAPILVREGYAVRAGRSEILIKR